MEDKELTLGDLYSVINRIDHKLEVITKTGPRFISRSRIIKEIGRSNYDYGVRSGRLNELKGPSRNSKVLIEKTEYENYIITLKQ